MIKIVMQYLVFVIIISVKFIPSPVCLHSPHAILLGGFRCFQSWDHQALPTVSAILDARLGSTNKGPRFL